MMFSRILAVAIVLAATLWIGSGVFGRTEQSAATDARTGTPSVRSLFRVAVVEANSEDHRRRLVLSGRTEADDRGSAVARTTGSVVELKVERGDVVKEGDVVATLSDEAREAQVAEAEALVEQRRADLDAKLQLIRRGISPANEENQLRADLRAAEAALARATAEHERGNVRAPISGVVTDVQVTTGQALQPGMTVAEVVALNPMLAVAETSERDLGGFKVGDRASVHLVTGQTAGGLVRYVSPSASDGTRTYRVEVALDSPRPEIPDGVTAEIGFMLAPVQAVRIPRSALTFSSAGELSVRVVGNDGVVASAPVAIVEDAPDQVWVSGPPDGSLIIVQGQDFVQDGQQVETVPTDGVAAPPLVSRS